MTAALNARVGRQLACTPDGAWLPVFRLSERQMKALPEYSATIPTGKRIGKTWKRRMTERSMWSSQGCGKTLFWTVGMYAELSPEDQKKWPGEIAILWFLPVVDNGQAGIWVQS